MKFLLVFFLSMVVFVGTWYVQKVYFYFTKLSQQVMILEQREAIRTNNEGSTVTYTLPDIMPRCGNVYVSDGDGALRKIDSNHIEQVGKYGTACILDAVFERCPVR